MDIAQVLFVGALMVIVFAVLADLLMRRKVYQHMNQPGKKIVAPVRTILLAALLALGVILVPAVRQPVQAQALSGCEFVNVYGITNHKQVSYADGDVITVTTYLQASETAQGAYCGQMRSYNTFTSTKGTHDGEAYGIVVWRQANGSYTSNGNDLGQFVNGEAVSGWSPTETTKCAAAEALLTYGNAGIIEVGTANYCHP